MVSSYIYIYQTYKEVVIYYTVGCQKNIIACNMLSSYYFRLNLTHSALNLSAFVC